MFQICFFTLLGWHREVYREFQPSDDLFRGSGAKGGPDHRFRTAPAYTAQWLTQHQQGANNQWKGHHSSNLANLTGVSSSPRTTLGTVFHPSTNWVQRGSTSVIVRKLVYPKGSKVVPSGQAPAPSDLLRFFIMALFFHRLGHGQVFISRRGRDTKIGNKNRFQNWIVFVSFVVSYDLRGQRNSQTNKRRSEPTKMSSPNKIEA